MADMVSRASRHRSTPLVWISDVCACVCPWSAASEKNKTGWQLTRWDTARVGEPGSRERLKAVLRDKLMGAMQGVKAGVTSPARAFSGEVMTNADMLATAGLAQLGGAAIPVRNPVKPLYYLENRTGGTYNIPTKSEVGHGVEERSGGYDLERRPLVARHVVGRAEAGGMERSLSPEALDEIATRFTGKPVASVSKASLPRGSLGAVDVTRRGSLENPRVLETLELDHYQRVAAHEIAHILDYAAGGIPTKGLIRELEGLYHYGVEGKFRDRHRTLPEDQGYKGEAIREEYIAEALRQYMVAPDTMKAMASKTAAAIRKTVNANPKLDELIREAQQQVSGYTYRGFCEKAVLAGCAGYIVSFSGRRALYVGRTAET